MSDSKQTCEMKGCSSSDGVGRVRVSGAAANDMDLYAYLCPLHTTSLLVTLKQFSLDKPVPRPGYQRPPSEEQEAEMKAVEGQEPKPHPKKVKKPKAAPEHDKSA